MPCGTINPMNFGGESNSVSGDVEHTAGAGASKSEVSLDESSVSKKAVMLAYAVPAWTLRSAGHEQSSESVSTCAVARADVRAQVGGCLRAAACTNGGRLMTGASASESDVSESDLSSGMSG